MIVSILILAGLVAACQDGGESGLLPEKDQMSLKTGQVYPAMLDNLHIRIREIHDSRCPVGVVCVWAGEASVTFEVKIKETFDLTLVLQRQPVDTVDHYFFRLIDVLPYPVYPEEVPDSEKTVILEVKRL